ncbi:hypothetical protein HOY82DRAFT_601295 [Tuber indicum]|nr:hypothetical protein HOY82DRAFT_601295 [Tuber indicum]
MTYGGKTIATTGEAMVVAMLKMGEQEKEIGRLRHHVSMLSKKLHEYQKFGVGNGVASVEEVAEELVEEVAQVAHPPPMDMELTEEEKVTEVQVSGEMLRVLREEEEKKAGWRVVARDNKKRKVDEVIVAPLGPKKWAVGKGKVGRVVVTNGVSDVVLKGPKSLRQFMKAEPGGRAARGLGIGPSASSIPKAPGALVKRGGDTECWDRGCLRRRG